MLASIHREQVTTIPLTDRASEYILSRPCLEGTWQGAGRVLGLGVLR